MGRRPLRKIKHDKIYPNTKISDFGMKKILEKIDKAIKQSKSSES